MAGIKKCLGLNFMYAIQFQEGLTLYIALPSMFWDASILREVPLSIRHY